MPITATYRTQVGAVFRWSQHLPRILLCVSFFFSFSVVNMGFPYYKNSKQTKNIMHKNCQKHFFSLICIMMKMRFQNVTKAFEHLKTFVFFLLTLQWEHKKPSLTKDRKGGDFSCRLLCSSLWAVLYFTRLQFVVYLVLLNGARWKSGAIVQLDKKTCYLGSHISYFSNVQRGYRHWPGWARFFSIFFFTFLFLLKMRNKIRIKNATTLS